MAFTQYQTTHITPTRSYPTYQFHADINSALSSSSVFRICILESLSWLRKRLMHFTELPQELCTPEPENYESFSEASLFSFSHNLGCSIDSVYLEKDGIWTLTISENDMGENIGSREERLPVQGRRFTTELSFIKYDDHVGFAIRTICSEPVDTAADCKVFRPTVVKMLLDNPLISLRDQYDIDGHPVIISTRSDAEKFCDIIYSDACDMPYVIVCEPEKLKNIKKAADVFENAGITYASDIKTFSSGNLSVLSGNKSDLLGNFSIKMPDREDGKKRKEDRTWGAHADVPKKKPVPKKAEVKDQYEYTDQKTIDCSLLAGGLIGYGMVCFISEKCVSVINNKLDIGLNAGDIAVFMHGVISEKLKFEEIKDSTEDTCRKLKYETRMMLKGAAFKYDSYIFGTDARLREMSEKNRTNMTLEEQLQHLENQRAILESKIRELENNDNGMRMNAEELRNVSRKLEAEIRSREKAEQTAKENEEKYQMILESYKNSSFVTDFYRKKAADAACFPLETDKVCDWAENTLSEGIIVTPRARNELKKYSGALETADLCDGLYFLNGYASYRRGEISESELSLYGEANNWEAGGCGKGALRTCADDYEISYDGDKYTLDLHIKNGVKSQQLIRIYFCWSEKLRKVIVGSMPGHLGTARHNT